MTQHTLKYIHKRRGFCKAEKIPEKAPEPEQTKNNYRRHCKLLYPTKS